MKLPYTTRVLPLLALAIAACSNPPSMDDAGEDAASDATVTDTRTDTGVRQDTGVRTDTGVDTGVDSGVSTPDADTDAGAEAGMDGSTGMDATPDSAPDAAPDSRPDSAPDSAPDASPDVVDARADSAPDATPDATPDASADAGPACPAATGNLTLPMGSVMGNLTASGGINSRISCSTLTGFSSGEQNFTLNVATRTGITLTTDNATTTAGLDTAIVVRRTCNDISSEIACDDDGTTGSPRSYARAVLEPGTYSVIVDGYSGASGSYRLDYATFTPAANATCATATALTAGMATMGSTANGGGNNSPCRTSTGTIVGGLVYYSFTIPANSRANFAVAATGAQNVRAYLTDSCSATTCAGSALTTTMGTAVNVSAGNTTASPRTVILAVGSTSLTTDAAFTVTPTVTAIAANASCSAPTTLAVGSTAMGDTAGAASTASCASSDLSQLYYQVSVPANSRAQLSITRGGSNNVRARVLDTCMAATCTNTVVTADATATPFVIPNPTAAAANFIVAVSGTTAAAPFTLTYTGVSSTPANASCTAPTAVAPGTSVMVDTSPGGSRPFGCNTTEGDVLYYSVTVPASSTSTLSLTRGSSTNMRARVLDTCTSTSCALTVATASATAVTLPLSNSSTMARTFTVAVGATGTSTSVGTATLAVSAPTPNPYVISTIAGTCSDMTMGTAVTSSSADDGIVASAALPFAFSFFGSPVTNHIISSNGFLQVIGASTTPITSSFASNAAMPDTASPNNIIAPFWDDLVLPTTTSIRTLVEGTAPNRVYTIQWTDPRPFSGTTLPTLRFQAKLFETTNVIEYHYCALMDATNTRTTGDSATIGVENNDGTAAVVRAFNTANSISVANAFRFTPNP